MIEQAPGGSTPGELLYSLSFLGAHLAFMPVFALLLPRRIAAIAPGQAIETLSALLLIGGVVASVAHIAAGRWSDRWLVRYGNRRGLIGVGLAALCAAQFGLAMAQTWAALIIAIVLFQLALNLMFAPLGALLADHVADARKGRVAGLLNAALPLSSIGTAAAALLFRSDGPGGFLLVALASALAILPLLIAWPFGSLAPLDDPNCAPAPSMAPTKDARQDYVKIWCARLLIQLGAAFVINYFYLYLVDLGGNSLQASQRIGSIAIVATAASFASAICAGFWSDRAGRRKPPLISAALAATGGLLILALEPSSAMVLVAYVLFQVGLTAFLSVDSAMVAQLLSNSRRRGELLGLMNLTNTLPAIIVPAIAMRAASGAAPLNWPLAFVMAAALALGALALVSRIRSIA
ncbi:MAG: MFS transporter [Sphingomicrobium sp.]